MNNNNHQPDFGEAWMTEKKAFEIIKEMHYRFDYYDLNDVSTCLDGRFSAVELRAIVFVMENKLSVKFTLKMSDEVESKRR